MIAQRVAVSLLALSLGLVVSGFPAEQPDNGKHWVVIVAGSNGWYNYRHQVRKEVIFEVEKVHVFPNYLSVVLSEVCLDIHLFFCVCL